MVAFIEKQINLNTSKTFIQYEKFTGKDKEILAGAEALNDDVQCLLWSDNVTIVKQHFINSDFPKLDEHMLHYKLLNKMQLEAITALNQNRYVDKVYTLTMDSKTPTINHGRILFTKKDENFEIIAVI